MLSEVCDYTRERGFSARMYPGNAALTILTKEMGPVSKDR